MKRFFFNLAIVLSVLVSSVKAAPNGPLFAPRPFSGDIHFGVEGLPTPIPGFTLHTKVPLDQLSYQLARALETGVNKAGLKFKGFGPYNVKIVRSKNPVVKGLVVGNDIMLEYHLIGNTVTTSFTTPDIVDTKVPIFGRIHFGADRAADPRVKATFDLVIRATITPQLHGAPVIKSASVHMSNAKLRPVNLSAKVLNAINDFVAWVGGPNFRGMAEKEMNKLKLSKNDPFGKTLRSLDGQIAKMTKDVKELHVMQESNRINIIYSTKVSPPLVVK
jgi:hypothetical protein